MEVDHAFENSEIIEEGLREEEVGLEQDVSEIKPEDDPETKEEIDEEQEIGVNRRGTPRRTIKKNKYFFDENMFNAGSLSPRVNRTPTKKTAPSTKKKGTPSYSSVCLPEASTSSSMKMYKTTTVRCSSPDRILGQRIGTKLKNLLKLPKAYRFVCCEFFYSNIDKPLFNDNDFVSYLKEKFPELKQYLYTRTEWCIIRRMMGKPRRCSSSFFLQERINLERKRTVIRRLQQGKWNDQDISVKDIPTEIPIQLVVGTKVTARVRSPSECDGLYTGIVDAFDTSNNTYRISFDRPTLGTQSIPDYEVLSNDTPETFNRQNFLDIYCTPAEIPEKPSKSAPKSADADSGEREVSSDRSLELVEQVVYFKNLVRMKKDEVSQIKEMNNEAEMKNLHGEDFDRNFKKKYAGHILKLESINRDLNVVLASLSVLQKSANISDGMSSQLHALTLTISDLQQETYIAAQEIVDSANKKNGKKIVENSSVIALVTDLTALMVQVKTLSHSSRNVHEVEVLDRTLSDIKAKLSPSNHSVFEDRLAIHVEKIKIALTGESSSMPVLKKGSE